MSDIRHQTSDIRQADTITNLRTATEHTDGNGVILSVAGEIDLSTAPQLKEALAHVGMEGVSVTIDLSDVTFMDSSGLHVLLTFASSMNGNGPVRIVNPSRTILRAMQIAGITGVPQIEIQQADPQHG